MFVDRLISTAMRRYRVRITDPQFGDWLREKLLAPPPKQQRKRNWTCKHYRTALEICRLKSQGVSDAGELKWHLWLKGMSPPNFDPAKARRHLRVAFTRLRKAAAKSVYSTYDPTRESEITAGRKAQIISSMGVQDARLKATLPLSGDEIFALRNLMQFDHQSENIPSIEFLIAKLLPQDIQRQLVGQLQGMSEFVALLGGISGPADEIENSGERSIRHASRKQFELARQAIRILPEGFRVLATLMPGAKAGFIAVAESAQRPEWRVAIFMPILHMLYRGDLKNPKFSTQLAEQIIQVKNAITCFKSTT